jgi:uncharacterized membrane protein (Fun14 family)
MYWSSILTPFKRPRVHCDDSSPAPFQLQSFLMSQTELITLGQPLSLGIVSGFCSGFFLKKVGKIFVLSSGVVFLLFHAAARHDYLTINWPVIDRDFNNIVQTLQGSSDVSAASLDPATFAASLFQQHTGITSTAFMAGLLIGLKKG